ncbi:glutaredoxin [Neisseria canis]|uniref:Glutaredoxin-related protein n=1 Tax=Neisseria canis TaxID=493 RepID=A0A448D5C7_9NEIS|nr:glutaredoxin [Neisseria canis]OSI11859.1 glutaredoxin [Neisseria canis]VEE99227.1 Glutaredoxin-related protein [Neisseria canis]
MPNLYFYSSLCPDTPPFDAALQELGVDCEAVNITESMANLKRFLQLRDTADAYASCRGTLSVGVPVLITENGDYVFSPEELMTYFGK